jgi:hypothetical protein
MKKALVMAADSVKMPAFTAWPVRSRRASLEIPWAA